MFRTRIFNAPVTEIVESVIILFFGRWASGTPNGTRSAHGSSWVVVSSAKVANQFKVCATIVDHLLYSHVGGHTTL